MKTAFPTIASPRLARSLDVSAALDMRTMATVQPSATEILTRDTLPNCEHRAETACLNSVWDKRDAFTLSICHLADVQNTNLAASGIDLNQLTM
jgi:hypothetical protein